MKSELIAPCGMNCAVCIGFLRDRNRCAGCLPDGKRIGHCDKCVIKLCDEHQQGEFVYCHECRRYPCARLRRLHKRYIEKYKSDLAGNLERIRVCGTEQFIAEEWNKWTYAGCGATLSVHREACLACGRAYR